MGQLTIEGRFLRSVYVRVGNEAHKIADADHALVVLTTYMTANTQRRADAVKACKMASRGELYAPIARRYFVSAALEARILAGD
jgi:hypothetical protein